MTICFQKRWIKRCFIGNLMLITLPMTLFSQAPNSDMYAPQGYSVISPSPEVASLMKHNEYPVSYFTGQPQINLPIYVVRQVFF